MNRDDYLKLSPVIEIYKGSANINKTSHDINNVTGLPDKYARLYLPLRAKGEFLKSYSSAKYGNIIESFFNDGGFLDLIISRLDLPFTEKVQLHSLWGDNYFAAYYGTNPLTISISGTFYNARNNDWWDNFINIYIDFLRGSKLSEIEETLCLSYYENNIFFSITSFSSSVTSDMQSMAQFGISGIIHYVDISTSEEDKMNTEPVTAEILSSKFPMAPLRRELDLRVYYNEFYKPVGDKSSNSTDTDQKGTTEYKVDTGEGK